MRRIRTALGTLTVAAALASGCDNGPPGGGVTNGPAPDLTADKQAIRTDGPDRDRTDRGEMKGAGGLSSMPDGGGAKDSGTGGKGGNSGESPAKATGTRTGDDRKDTVQAVGSAAAQPPAGKDSAAPGGGAGATKPAGDIKVGTPKSPQ